MRKLSLSKFISCINTMITKHSPEILTGIGIAGMITTTVMAVKATPKALNLLENERDQRKEDLTKVEIIKTAWKPYLPATITGTLSIICLVEANSVNIRRNTVLATACSLYENDLIKYKEKVVETVGEKKEKEIRDEIAKDIIDDNPSRNSEVIITEKGNTLCYDTISGRYFKSDMDKIKRVENELNRNLMNEMYISLNEFYYEIGLNSTKLGDDLGWNVNEGLIDISFSTQLADDGTPCLVMDYHIAPRYEYKHLM